ncbi:2bd7bcb1-edf0-4af4-a5fd-05812858634f [Sclerotinia trifoliorum]|uniref:ribonuclease T1 n=1 Tax=Sclerotinia trifoliorum TaxID=28548 RepID=A0A8H2VXZ5_9HELO|nr:2bd7bcb1-edf0-4af4-a5fd-05812858634f [Sclerotinia trifoliorum]
MATIYDEPVGCNCDNESTYDQATIDAACKQALKLASEKKTVGRDKYPHVYNDYEKFTFLPAAKKPYLEFPILANGEIYTGSEPSSPGADRIVIGSIATDYQSAIFCAVITHDGSKKNGFTECANTGDDGEGAYGRRDGQDEGKDGRDLLEWIDL